VRISTTAIRGLIHRSRATILIFMLALVGTAAATAGPAYYQAARTSILRDSLTSSSFVGQGFEATESGPLSGLLSGMAGMVQGRLGTYLGPLNGQHLFAPPVESAEASIPVGDQGSSPLVWRTDFCTHLRFQGTCPTKTGEVLVNNVLAKALGWKIGSTIADGDRVTGIYQLPSQTTTYWSARYSIYFPGSTIYNAVFTPQATLYNLPSTAQGTVAFDDVLASRRVSTSDVNGLTNAMNGLTGDGELGSEYISITTAIPATMADVQSSWHEVAVPIALITGEVLALCLLLLFTAVTETVDGRAGDIALARLRGQGRIRTMAFGLSEPLLVLLVSLPVGVVIGWLTVRYLSGVMLRPGTPVTLPFLAWVAAAGVLVAGVAAVLRAAIRAVRRPVVDHLRGSGQHLTRRGWIVDAILATAAVAGLADLIGSGRTQQSSHSTLGLLVPGLLGLTVALVASRLLPVVCRLAFPVTARRGGLGLYLALRHIARRPGAIRTTIVLSAAFALATYAIGAWLVARNNEHVVAATEVGAPTVLTVSVPAGQDIASVVDKVDPSGHLAAGVLSYTDLSQNSAIPTLLAVQPQRFAAVAASTNGFGPAQRLALERELDPPAAPEITVSNDEPFRLTFKVDKVSGPGAGVTADFTEASGGYQALYLGALPTHGTVTLSSNGLAACPCTLLNLDVGTEESGSTAAVAGAITLTAMQTEQAGQWRDAAPGALSSASRWRSYQQGRALGSVTAGSAGLAWSFDVGNTHGKSQDAILQSADTPDPLPAVTSGGVAQPGSRNLQASGLDGNSVNLDIASTSAVLPGLVNGGALVDEHYAELAADFDDPDAVQQVWLADGAQSSIEPRLRADGVQILSVDSTAAVASSLGRQGPGLTNILMLADAIAALLLASGSAVLSLFLSARRRRYEYAALEASGVKRAALRRSVFIEIGVVCGFGCLSGIGAGLAAIVIALPGVPEFLASPAGPVLNYVPPIQSFAVSLAACVAVLLAAGGIAAAALIRGIRPDQLRETLT
jgi:putative ABC transport system permease protein